MLHSCKIFGQSGKETQLKVTQSQVVGLPHEEYGAVPVAVVKALPKSTNAAEVKQSMKDKVKSYLGAEYIISDIIQLEELELVQWPLNSSDKIVKKDLIDAIRKKGLCT